MIKFTCSCGSKNCTSFATLTNDGYLIIREYRPLEHHIASIKLPNEIAIYLCGQFKCQDDGLTLIGHDH